MAEPVPQRRMRLLERTQHHGDFSIDVARPAVLEHLAGQPLQHDGQGLLVDLLRLEMVEVEERHLIGDDPAAHAEVEAAAREMVEHADFLDEPQRVVERQAVHAGAEANAPRALGGGGEEEPGHRGQAQRRRVMLGQVIGVEAARVVFLQQAQPALVVLVHGHVAPVEMVEDPEVHGARQRKPPPGGKESGQEKSGTIDSRSSGTPRAHRRGAFHGLLTS
jgi:hypothetical protein